MALINCPECGKQISDQAVSCPQCGYPISKMQPASRTPVETPSTPIENTSNEPQQNEEDARKNKRILLGIGGFVLLLVLIFGMANSSDNSKKKTNSQAKTTVAETTAAPKKTYNSLERGALITIGRGLPVLRDALKDPDSLQILEMKAIENIAYYKYTATNSYGGRITGYAEFTSLGSDQLWESYADEYDSLDPEVYYTYTVDDYNEFVENQ